MLFYKKKFNKHRLILNIFISIAVFLVLYLYFFPQIFLEYFYFPSTNLISISDSVIKKNLNDIYIKTADGAKLNFWEIPAKQNKSTIIFCHGDGGNISFYQEIMKPFFKAGYGIIMIDYRGFGKSSGSINEKGVYTDLNTVIHYLKAHNGIKENNIILWGYSFGGAVVSEIASHGNYRGVILHSTFTNAKEMRIFEIEHKLNIETGSIADLFVKSFINSIPASQKFNTKAKIKKIKSPLLIAHDIPDRVVPVQMAYILLKSNRRAIPYISTTGSHADFNWIINRILNFVKTLK